MIKFWLAIWITDTDPYRDTGKTCLGGGMHCPSASSYLVEQQQRAQVTHMPVKSITFSIYTSDNENKIKRLYNRKIK